jgi:ubiquinone/menaquinone biosynthesis C-methylase UbiE
MPEQDKGKEKKFFDEFSLEGDYDVFTDKGYRRLIKAFLEMVPAFRGDVVLDLGCGTGAFTRRFTHFGNTIVGIDISFECARFARHEHPGLHFINGDIEKLPFLTGSFDYIIFTGVLHHFPDYTQCLKEGWRVLRKGGYLLAFEPNKLNPFMWIYRSESSPVHSRTGRTENEQLIAPGEIESHLSGMGFKKVAVKAVSGIPFKYVESGAARFLLPVYNAIDWLWGISPFSERYGAFLICCGKK